MKKNLNRTGIIILIIIFALFYLVTVFFLDRRNVHKTIDTEEPVIKENNNYDSEKEIVSNLYKDVRILYDVVNNKFKVDQNNTITIGDIVYKKITNIDEVTENIFTDNGRRKYITDLGNYFAYMEDNEYYLAGNLVSYQTYYFRGDNTNIYITNASEKEINAIIYERWTSNNRNTLATVRVIYENNKWLIDNLEILSAD